MLAGLIGSGKTTLACALVATTKATYVGFGDYVRAEAERRKLALDRRGLQELGTELITAAGGAAEFCEQVIGGSTAVLDLPLVIDGVRAAAMLERCQQLAVPREARLVWVEVSEEVRRARLSERGFSAEEIAAADAHPSEVEAAGLRALAEVVVRGDDETALVTAFGLCA